MTARTLTPAMIKRLVLGVLLEFGPILIFLGSFGYLHIYKATMLLMVATIVSTILAYRLQKRLPYLALYLAFLTIAFGYLTLMHREPRFIQMRDTLYDLTCAVTLMVGIIINVNFLKLAFHDVVPMSVKAWHRLTYAWIGFFLLAAGANEFVRRTYELHIWFDFKSSMVLTTILFGCLSLYLSYEPHQEYGK